MNVQMEYIFTIRIYSYCQYNFISVVKIKPTIYEKHDCLQLLQVYENDSRALNVLKVLLIRIKIMARIPCRNCV